MRYQDIKMQEASLNGGPKDDKYLPTVQNIIDNGDATFLIGPGGNQGTFIANKGQRVSSRTQSLTGTIDGKPANINVSQIFKTQQLVGAAAGQDASTVAGKISNRGNTSEGILGAATLARLIKRPGTNITIEDLRRVIDQFPPAENNSGGTISVSAKELENPIVDKFSLTVKLPINNYVDFKDVNKLLADKEMLGIINNIISYTNTTNTDRYAKMFELNGRPDEVAVISDGVSDMSGRKTDVAMIYIDKNGERITKHFDLSLKVGSVKQFGQTGGGVGNTPDDESFDILKNMFVTFGIDIEAARADYKQSPDKYLGYVKAYNEAGNQFKIALAGSNADTEKVFLKKFINALQFYGTRNEPHVKLLQFEKGQFFLLDFKKADRLLSQDKIDLDAKMTIGKTAEGIPLPRVTIFNKVDNIPFLTIRVKKESGKDYIRNYIDKEDGLKNLLKVRSGNA